MELGEDWSKNFGKRMENASDEELISILKKRRGYQPKAVEIVTREAIRRGIIHSEQDLWAEVFQEEEKGSLLFPVIEDDEVKQKLRRSLIRALLICGLVPGIYGVIQLYQQKNIWGILPLLFSLLWLLAAFSLRKTHREVVIRTMLVAVALALLMVFFFLPVSVTEVMDYLVLILLTVLPVYALLYLRKLKL